jgi:hypothetical protein
VPDFDEQMNDVSEERGPLLLLLSVKVACRGKYYYIVPCLPIIFG